jgi:zinc D-Ala-D-Ala carboxypeptidase
MTPLSKDFTVEEFKCPCGECLGGRMREAFVKKLQAMRDAAGITMKVTSGFRCMKYNAKVGGESDSQHLLGNAADIYVSDGAVAHALMVAAFVAGFKGIGINRKNGQDGFLHVDDRDSAAVIWTYK